MKTDCLKCFNHYSSDKRRKTSLTSRADTNFEVLKRDIGLYNLIEEQGKYPSKMGRNLNQYGIFFSGDEKYARRFGSGHEYAIGENIKMK
ncbi:MAG: hypothetical protein SPJ83_02365 [Helicobacter sp.]|uniref:hypothetical protein n=1 Tax=Helicobacter sp. TaxID=218 RepID=UPI002A91A5EF|nr:hypothetical protein [Helicobacter sp.]MDY5821632.1 hypothetical protein [Helicobacter sp.]